MRKIDFKAIDSTSTYIKNNYNDLDHLTFVSSLFQSKGKGRNTRIWQSQEGKNLLFSVLIKEQYLIDNFASLSLLSAFCIFNVLNELNVKNVSIKWPNDVYVNDKKICGILLEGISFDNKLQALIIGVGLNVNQDNFDNLNATSIYLNTNTLYPINEIKEKVYNEFLLQIDLLLNEKSNYLQTCREYNYLKNKEVYAFYQNEKIKVKVLDINNDNSLKVLFKDNIFNINSGEISFHKDDENPY